LRNATIHIGIDIHQVLAVGAAITQTAHSLDRGVEIVIGRCANNHIQHHNLAVRIGDKTHAPCASGLLGAGIKNGIHVFGPLPYRRLVLRKAIWLIRGAHIHHLHALAGNAVTFTNGCGGQAPNT
jgi:hypothetical protein